MKKQVLILATFLLVVVASAEEDWYDANTGYTWSYYVKDGNAEIRRCRVGDSVVPGRPTGALIIPSTLGDCPVTSIGSSVFYGCSGLTSVTIPSSVTSIGDYAFQNCSGLPSVTMPEGVTSIGSSVFKNCSGLTKVTIPEGVTSIGKEAFYKCSSLPSVTIPSSVTSIGSSAFSGCSGLTSVTISSGVTSIGDSAFSGCSVLTEVTIPSSVMSIGGYAFWGCSGLTKVTMPEGVTSIGDSAFSGCSVLTEVTIPSSVMSIGDYAFYGCSSLTSVTISTCVTSIGNRAFYGCPGVLSVMISSADLTIGEQAFYSCDNLESVTIKGKSCEIGSQAFSSCKKLSSLDLSSESVKVGQRAFYGCDQIGAIDLPTDTSLSKEAFYGCDGEDFEVYFHGGLPEVDAGDYDVFSSGIGHYEESYQQEWDGIEWFYGLLIIPVGDIGPSYVVHFHGRQPEETYSVVGSVADQVFVSGQAQELHENKFSRTGYDFSHWKWVITESSSRPLSASTGYKGLRTSVTRSSICNDKTLFAYSVDYGYDVEANFYAVWTPKAAIDLVVDRSEELHGGNHLSWSAQGLGASAKYDVYRGTNGVFSAAVRIGENVEDLWFDDLTWSVEYAHVSALNYWVVAKDGDVEIGRSEMATVSVSTEKKSIAPVACDWIKGEIELGWSGADVSYKLFWSTSSDPDVSTNDVQREVKIDVALTEEGAYRFTCKDPEYLKRGDCLQPIYYHIVGTDGSWSFCKTRNRHGIFYGLAKYDKVKFPELSERENRAESAEFFAKMMKEQGGMEKDNARCRVDGEATIGNLRKDFNEVAELVIPGDVFIFFCSTHGGSSKEGRTRVCLYDDRYFDNELALTLKSVGTRSDGTSKDVAIINVIAACHSGGFFEIDGKSDEYLDDWYVSEQLARCSPNIAWVTSASYDSNSWGFSPYPMLQTFMLYYGWRQGWAGTDEYVTFGELARYAKGMVHDLMYDECKTEPQLEPELGGVLDAIRAGKRGKHSAMSIPSESALSYVSRGEYPDKVVCEWKGTDGADGYALFEKRERDEIWSCGGCVLADSSCQENGYSCQWAFKKDENRPYVDDKGKFHIKAYNGAGISPASDAVDGWCSWVEGKIGDLSYAYNLNTEGSATLLRIGGRGGLKTEVAGPLSLPSEVDGHQVLTIAAGALRNCSGITQVTVPNTMRYLLPTSFPNCTGLNTVIFNGAMPDGIEESRILDHATEVYYPQVYAAQYEKVVPAELFAGYSDVNILADGVYKETVDGIEWMFYVSEGVAEITSGESRVPAISDGTRGDIVIPSILGGCPVTSIGVRAFRNCNGLTSVTIPEGVTSIGGREVFIGCSALTRINVNSANRYYCSIDGALYDKDVTDLICCPGGAKSVTIPEGVTSIGPTACYFCGGLTSVTIPSSVMSIGDDAFMGCVSLKCVTISPGVTRIGHYMFDGCISLTSVTIPSSVASIGECAFAGCISLTSVTIPEGVTSIGIWAFRGSGLTSVTIPGSVILIREYAFGDCENLKLVDFAGAPPADVADDAFVNVQAGCVGTYRAEHAGAWARVIDGNGMWKGLKMVPYDESVREAAVSLRNGWNWISVNVVPTDAAFANAFGDVAFAENDVIQSPDGSATYSGGAWHPNPSSFELVAGRAYAVKKSTAGMATVMVSGTAAPAEIAVAAGWNWIGPTATSSVPLGSLTHTGGFSDGDIINSPTASATYHGGTWYGELKSIVPGSGYKARFGKAGTLRFK